MSTSVTTTRTGLISDLGRTPLVVELQRHRLRVATRLSLCRDSVVCITATQSRPKPSTAVNWTAASSRGGEIHFWPAESSSSPPFQDDLVIEDLTRGAPFHSCLLYTSPSPRDRTRSRMPSSS